MGMGLAESQDVLRWLTWSETIITYDGNNYKRLFIVFEVLTWKIFSFLRTKHGQYCTLLKDLYFVKDLSTTLTIDQVTECLWLM